MLQVGQISYICYIWKMYRTSAKQIDGGRGQVPDLMLLARFHIHGANTVKNRCYRMEGTGLRNKYKDSITDTNQWQSRHYLLIYITENM